MNFDKILKCYPTPQPFSVLVITWWIHLTFLENCTSFHAFAYNFLQTLFFFLPAYFFCFTIVNITKILCMCFKQIIMICFSLPVWSMSSFLCNENTWVLALPFWNRQVFWCSRMGTEYLVLCLLWQSMPFLANLSQYDLCNPKNYIAWFLSLLIILLFYIFSLKFSSSGE